MLTDVHTQLLLARGEQRERERFAADAARARRLVRLRQLDRRADAARVRAHRARLAFG